MTERREFEMTQGELDTLLAAMKGNYIHDSLDNSAGVIYIHAIDNGGGHDRPKRAPD